MRAFLLRYRVPAVFAALAIPLLAGVLATGPLAGREETAAARMTVRARADGVLAGLEALRDREREVLGALLDPTARQGPSLVRGRLRTSGWEPFPGLLSATSPGEGRVDGSFLEAAGREGIVVEWVPVPDSTQFQCGIATPAGIIVATRAADAALQRALGSDAEVGAAFYTGGVRVASDPSPLGGLLPRTLDEDLVTRVIGEDRAADMGSGPALGLLAAAVPLKDLDAWDALGVLVVGTPRVALIRDDAFPGSGRRALALLLALGVAALGAAAAAGRLRLRIAGPAAIAGLALLFGILRARLHDVIASILLSGPAAVRTAEAAGGLVERFAFPFELALLGGLVLFLLLAAGVLVTARYLDRPRTLRSMLTAWVFLAPAVVGLLVFFLGPMLFALYISLHQWSIVEPIKPFVGLTNYTDLVKNADFVHALWTTFLFCLHVPVSMALALGLALLLNRPLRGVGIFRTLFFLPSITSFVAIAMVWQWIYNPDFGLANWLLGFFGSDGSAWLTDPRSALPSLMLMAVWIGMGYQMVIYLAGLQSIPGTLYESARMDGAGPIQRFFRITLPLLRPTTFFILVTSIIGSFQVFTQVYIMTDGGPVRATDVVVYHIYSAAWDQFRMGSAAAMSWVLFALLMLVTLLQFRWAGRDAAYF